MCRKSPDQGSRALVRSLAREHLRAKALVQEYAEAVTDENAEHEARQWIESGVADALADEDFSGWPGCPTS